jgi:hypothetical protein
MAMPSRQDDTVTGQVEHTEHSGQQMTNGTELGYDTI